MGLLLLGVLVAITIAFFLVPGIGVIAVVPLVAAVLVGIWVAIALAGRTSPSQLMRRTRRRDLLGPGGIDDPDRTR